MMLTDVLLVACSALPCGHAFHWNQIDFTSPLVLPSPSATGLKWEDAFNRATGFVSQMTFEEKLALLTGGPGICEGNIPPIERLGFGGMCIQDGPLGVRFSDYASVFPAGLTVGASWDRDQTYARARQIGDEFKAKGVHVMLGPMAGPLGRSPFSGRDYEGFSPDPYLAGELFGLTVSGVQDSGVQSNLKREFTDGGADFIGNEQETQRNPSYSANGTETAASVSSNIDDRTMHELYLWPFANAVKMGASSVMCSYNRVNGTYACENSKLLNGLLKGELGFQGNVMSDWGATHAGVSAINAGHDLDMPGNSGLREIGTIISEPLFAEEIPSGVRNGSLTVGRLDDACRRVMTPYFWLDQSTYPPADVNPTFLNPGIERSTNSSKNDVRSNHAKLIRKLGADGIVLLKNVNNALPLRKPDNIGVFGNAAGDVLSGPRNGGLATQGQYEYGVLATGIPQELTYVITPLQAIQKKAAEQETGALVQYVLNNTQLITYGLESLSPTPPEVCLVFLKAWASEGADRNTLMLDWDGNTLVEKIASTCSNTVVVTNNGGLNVLPFADHPNVTAILAAHWGGQEQGHSIADVLWGDVNPSGHLPYTIPYHESDYTSVNVTSSPTLVNGSEDWRSDFKERLLIDYRHFDKYNISVQYEFGHGLSYTTFTLGNLSIVNVAEGPISATPSNGPTQPGGNPELWRVLFNITTTLRNAGNTAGATVPQLYLQLPSPPGETDNPRKVLRGFDKVFLEPGESRQVVFSIMRRDVSHWDIVSQQWVIADGKVEALVGFSSRDIRTRESFSILSP